MKEKLARLGFVALLVVPAAAGIACDREDQRDVEEVGNDVENQIDEADKDGKDD
ncbi:MAG: hypothetical protein KY391_01245 [Actinobacteria bacterium]|nr:hypothetical protein [Actinomycetota bacterium]